MRGTERSADEAASAVGATDGPKRSDRVRTPRLLLGIAVGMGVTAIALAAVAAMVIPRMYDAEAKLSDAEAKLQDQSEAIRSANEASSELALRVGTLESGVTESKSALDKLNDRADNLAEHTEGVGFKMLGWEFTGIAAARSLHVTARPKKDAPATCVVAGYFQRAGTLPSQAKARITREGGEQVYETTVDLSSGRFSLDVPTSCDEVGRLLFSGV